jgi:hypothetical protein
MIKVIPLLTAIAGGAVLLLLPSHWDLHLLKITRRWHHEEPVKKQSKAKRERPARQMHSMSHESTPGMDHGAGHSGHVMKGILGPYGIGHESSGTSWQPDNSPREGIHAQYGDWMTTWHALLNGVYDDQVGPRGELRPLRTAWRWRWQSARWTTALSASARCCRRTRSWVPAAIRSCWL